MNFSVKILCGYRCNQCCPYCDTPKAETADFKEFDKAKEIIEMIKDSVNFRIELDGGEVTEYPEIIQWASQFDVPVTIFTNGTQITQSLCDLTNDKVNFRISLDGPEDLHNAQKIMKSGENGYQKILAGIKILKTNKKHFFFGTTVTENTIPRLEECRFLFRSLGADRCILTSEMFENDPLREKTKAIWEKAAPIIASWYDPFFQYHSFHEQMSNQPNIEILFKYNKIELNIVGYSTPTLKTFSFDQIDELKEAIKQYED